MIDTTKLMRGVALAVIVTAAAPLMGASVPLLGVPMAQAQDQLVASVLFEGNRRFTDEQLLAMVDISSSGIFSQQRLQADTESIRQAYDREGFRNVSVTSRVEAVADSRARVVFVVDEGTRAGVAAINFTGNNSVNGGNLKSAISTKETGFLSWLFKDDTYADQKVAIDREIIRRYYANRGYPDAQVNSVTEFDAARNAYFVNFTINEGEEYRFGNIGIETSIPGLNSDALRGDIETGKGSRYSMDDLQRSTEELALGATSQGFSFADVRPRIDRDVNSRTFNVTYLVDEGARIYVERINITGNEKTRDFVIRRELEFGEGDPFNRSIITRGRSNIEGLGFFDNVEVTSGPGSSPDKVVINVAVTEKSTGEYGATAGYSTSDGILGEISLTERNFLGRGQFLRASIGATESGRTFDFSFTEPRFMGLRVSSGVDVYHRINDESSTSFYGTTATGGQLRFGVPITRDLSSTVFVGYERKVIVDNVDTANADTIYATKSSLQNDGTEYNKAFIGYTLTYNALDSLKKPTEGLYATFTQQYNGWDQSDVRSEARARYFMPLLDDSGLIGSIRGQAGIINDVGDDGINSIEAFSPGASLIRGFEGRGVGPRLVSGEYVGATMYAGISGEIEFPIPVLPESYGLRGAVFADAAYIDDVPNIGSVPVDAGSVDEPWRTSIGASIIWDSPFGPLRGDFAHVLNKATSDRTQVFQLTLSSLL